jgi:hypothetical protein
MCEDGAHWAGISWATRFGRARCARSNWIPLPADRRRQLGDARRAAESPARGSWRFINVAIRYPDPVADDFGLVLAAIARKEIDAQAEKPGVPAPAVRAALNLTSSDGRTYEERLERVQPSSTSALRNRMIENASVDVATSPASGRRRSIARRCAPRCSSSASGCLT